MVFERQGSYLDLMAGTSMDVYGNLALNDRDGIHLGDSFCNDAWVQNLALEYDTSNNSSHVCGTVDSADLALDIQAVGDEPEYTDDPVVFQIHYANNGNVTGSLAVLKAEIAKLVYGPTGAGQHILDADLAWDTPVDLGTGWQLSWSSLSPIAPGDSGIITLTGYLNSDEYLPGQSICLTGNFFSEYAESLDHLSYDNSASACHYVTGQIADLLVTKDILSNLTGLEQGDEVAYRLYYANTGSYPADDVVLQDTMPNELISLSVPSNCSISAKVVSCNL
ncbi:MAG: hypothetical protein GXP45_03600 [bacterium]|nr:hypothetical protein [bacterium]